MRLVELDSRLIQLNIVCEKWQEAIKAAVGPLEQYGLISEHYVKSVLEREEKWPTGLPAAPYGIAIPHAEQTNDIFKSGISVAVLKNSVPFRLAGGKKNDFVEVKLIFLLAIKNPDNQLEILQNLMDLFSNENKVGKLVNCENPEEFINCFNNE